LLKTYTFFPPSQSSVRNIDIVGGSDLTRKSCEYFEKLLSLATLAVDNRCGSGSVAGLSDTRIPTGKILFPFDKLLAR